MGIYGAASAAVGPGAAVDAGTFTIFSQPNKYFTFKTGGSAIGWDAGVSAGGFLIFGPPSLKGKDLQGWGKSVEGGFGFGEITIQTSCTRGGYPTFDYAIIGVGLTLSIPGGSYNPTSYTHIFEHQVRKGAYVIDFSHIQYPKY